MRARSIPLTAMAMVLAGVAVGCRESDRARADTTDAARVTSDTAAAADTIGAGSLNDAQVSTLVSHVHGSEIAAAQAVMTKLADPRVRAYAQSMLEEHHVMDSTLRMLPLQRDTMSRPPAQFATMQAAAKAQGAVLASLPAGGAVDRAYIGSQVANHGAAIDSLRRWRQVARNGGLASSIDATLVRVQAHLDRAHSIQSALGGALDTGATTPPTVPLAPRVETPATPLGSQKPDTVTARLGKTTRIDSARARRP